MAYFPNGISGDMFQEFNCSKCANADEFGMCAIWDAHMIYNYDQLEDRNKDLRGALNMLINDDANECRMFRKAPDRAQQGV